MPTKTITYRERPRDDVHEWAQRQGTNAEIEQTAQWLLEELREEYPKAQVSINDQRVRYVPTVAATRTAPEAFDVPVPLPAMVQSGFDFG